MELNIRKLEALDYEDILLKWWHDRGWSAPSKDFLPDNGTGGMIVYEKTIPVCAGFIYMTNSNIAWVNWIISDKNYKDKGIRNDAITMLLNSLVSIAIGSNRTYVFAGNNNPSLIKRFIDFGFAKGNNDTTELILKI